MAHRLRPLTFVVLGACGGWTPDGEQRVVDVEVFQQDFDCDGGAATVELPTGLPVLLQVYGVAELDDGHTSWWQYSEPPRFQEGGTLTLSCDAEQIGGRVAYVHE